MYVQKFTDQYIQLGEGVDLTRIIYGLQLTNEVWQVSFPAISLTLQGL